MNRVPLQIAQFIVGELRGCLGPYSRKEVVERVMRHNSVWPSFTQLLSLASRGDSHSCFSREF